ncbi:hypothetical protein O9H85_18755 [Paenibacillus filicis]|uniref:Uncharacterized protein n=1 Tax=Paenibacillus gyeongsangnamensis TaxID=3388067 RepID=A0ABT4QC46_9BACL|nr:hypothetical protein [Paenibacillus filicis]MCZ8514426.1 hypothetical protein [Paenibacillus filicis]
MLLIASTGKFQAGLTSSRHEAYVDYADWDRRGLCLQSCNDVLQPAYANGTASRRAARA